MLHSAWGNVWTPSDFISGHATFICQINPFLVHVYAMFTLYLSQSFIIFLSLTQSLADQLQMLKVPDCVVGAGMQLPTDLDKARQ